VVAVRFGQDPADSKITVAMISDSLDQVGLRNQTLNQRLAPTQSGTRAIGYAKTCRFISTDQLDPAKPYDAAIDFIDGSQVGDLIVISTENSNASAFWGELFSAAAKGRGAVGIVTDGNVRDVEKIRAVGFPAFSRSHRPVDFKGRMVLSESGGEIELCGVKISQGDLVAADDDGIAVVPISHHDQVLVHARSRAKAESVVLTELLGGATLREVWTRHGIL
jgi:4-hydroxy-4-methyl-2-oxoglutarate aldolase